MPQLVKGGKYTYGWSRVDSSGAVLIPPEAMAEYGFKNGQKVILFNGSRRSGGFCIARPEIFTISPFTTIAQRIPELINYQLPEGYPIKTGVRSFCWTTINVQGVNLLSPAALNEYGIKLLDTLLTIRGSNRALAFARQGPIIEEAGKHPELPLFNTSSCD